MNAGGGVSFLALLSDSVCVISLSVDKKPHGKADGKQNETKEKDVNFLKTNTQPKLKGFRQAPDFNQDLNRKQLVKLRDGFNFIEFIINNCVHNWKG